MVFDPGTSKDYFQLGFCPTEPVAERPAVSRADTLFGREGTPSDKDRNANNDLGYAVVQHPDSKDPGDKRTPQPNLQVEPFGKDYLR